MFATYLSHLLPYTTFLHRIFTTSSEILIGRYIEEKFFLTKMKCVCIFNAVGRPPFFIFFAVVVPLCDNCFQALLMHLSTHFDLKHISRQSVRNQRAPNTLKKAILVAMTLLKRLLRDDGFCTEKRWRNDSHRAHVCNMFPLLLHTQQ